MSRFCAETNAASILEAAERWKQAALLADGSVFSDEKLWTIENLSALESSIRNSRDDEPGGYWEKLRQQLGASEGSACRLAAEVNWLMLLCPNNTGHVSKSTDIRRIWDLGGTPLPSSADRWLTSDVLGGIGSGGTGYNTHRWRELNFALTIFVAFKRLPTQKQMALANDQSGFSEWLASYPDSEKRQFRHMLLFLLFPDTFERIFGGSDRAKIVKTLGESDEKANSRMTAIEIDGTLSRIRKKYENKYGTTQIDFYAPPLSDRWGSDRSADLLDLKPQQFVSDLIHKFIKQADERSSQSTANYPNTYRGLEIKLSFGFGNYAEVPWVSFLGTGQITSKGIYPVLLYYRELATMILAYGVSETHESNLHWIGLPDGTQTVREYFNKEKGRRVDKYGSSWVALAMSVSNDLDVKTLAVALDRMIDTYRKILDPSDVAPETPHASMSYTLEDALKDVFIPQARLEEMVRRLGQKKNLILQGPPGVGKTYVARRLAYLLMKEKQPSRVGMVQFHQAYAYEDFVQGYRPDGTGFRKKNGVFHTFCDRARGDPDHAYVFVIDEINRANLSKVFGELMMLIESDKRGPTWAMPLTYAENEAQTFYVPPNVHIVGLMNTADRSLAMVDYALRRRFAFMDVEPGFDTEQYRAYMLKRGATNELIARICTNVQALNAAISEDSANLGKGFRIGHSYFCTEDEDSVAPDDGWYQEVIRSEISPLLQEYWFDMPDQHSYWLRRLLEQ